MRIGYARISTSGQTLDAQVQMLKRHGCDEIYQETVSGASEVRPVFDGMLRFARAQDVIVVTKIDRLARSVRQLVNTVETLRERNIGFVVITQSIDTTTTQGRFVFNIFAALAQMEREMIIERTNEGLDAARRRGVKLGRPKKLNSPKLDMAYKLMRQRAEDGWAYSMSEIAKEVGVSRTLLHSYFKNREPKDDCTKTCGRK